MPPEPRDAAVIDVGSNSIRLVIYRIDAGAIQPILNERAAAGLGRNLPQTGRLDEEGVAGGIRTLERFRMLLDARGVTDVTAVATAAVRDAEDGPEFARRVERALRVKLDVLSGAAEGYYSALGVIAGDRDAEGIAADLGGSSMEFAHAGGGRARGGLTLRTGPLALVSEVDAKDREALTAAIDARLDAVDLAPFMDAPVFYAVGGAWRNLARVEMSRTRHPVRVLHGYELAPEAAIEAAERAWKRLPAQLARIQGVSRRRAELLPVAAVVLCQVLKRLKPKRFIVSAYGLREGLLFARLNDAEQRADSLIAGLEAVVRRAGGSPEFGAALADWLEPVSEIFGPAFGPDRDPRLFAAACRLADLSGVRHPDHRAEIAFLETLFAPVAGLNHAERVFLARAAHHRYMGRHGPRDHDGAGRLLSAAQAQCATRLGFAMRLGADITGRAPDLLARAALRLENGALKLSAPATLVDDTVEKRLGQLASACGLNAKGKKN